MTKSSAYVRQQRKYAQMEDESGVRVAHIKRVLISNIAAIVGWLLSALTVPPDTPLWIWVFAGIAFIILLNTVLYYRARRGLLATLSWPGALRLKDYIVLAVTMMLLLLGYWVREWPW